MAVTKLSNLGEIVTNFLLNDFDMYLMNTSATGGYVSSDWALVGFTSAEKTITPIDEKYIREDKIPRIPTYRKTIRAGLEISCDISNQNETFEAMVSKGVISTNSTGTRIAHGTDQASEEYRAVRFVAKRDDDINYAITIPKCSISINGEKTYGGEEEVKTPLLLTAVYNSQADATANLYYENYWNTGVSVTADVPPGY